MDAQEARKSKKLKMIILILLLLFVISAGACTARVVYLNFLKDRTATTVAPNNLIGEDDQASIPTTLPQVSTPAADAHSDASQHADSPSDSEPEAASIRLHKRQTSDNQPFQAKHMLPGDREVKYYTVKVSHHAKAVVCFHADVTAQTKSLAEVLHIRVTRPESGKVLYDGTFADVNEAGYAETFPATSETETIASYKVEVSLPTTTGNEHQAAMLLADFRWTVKDPAVLDSPQTGDSSNIVLYFVIMSCSLAMIILLLYLKRREREVDHAAEK